MNNVIEDTFVIIDPEYQFVQNIEDSFHDETFKLIRAERNFKDVAGMLEEQPPEFIVNRVPDQPEIDFEKIINTIKKIKQITTSKIVLVNVKEEKELLQQLIDLEVNGIVNDKCCSVEETLKNVKKYSLYLSTNYQKVLLNEVQEKPLDQAKHYTLTIDQTTAMKYLTVSETDILHEILTEGGSNEKIAKKLFLAPKTVKNYVSSMMAKLEASNRTHLISKSIKKGIIQLR